MDTHDPATVITVLEAAGEAGVTPLIWGDPGIGKSALVEGLAAARGVPCETVLGSLCEPADIGGLPVVADTAPGEAARVNLAPPRYARMLAEAGEGVLFLDELSTVPHATQAAMLGVVFGRRIGELTLPRGVKIVAAANPPDRAADGQELPAPMANRLLHINYAPTAESWFEGMLTGFATPAALRALPLDPARRAAAQGAVVGFLRTREELLQAFPSADTADAAHAVGRAWPSRRSWDLCADVLACLPDEATTARHVAVAGLVGDGPAAEFAAWREHADLPTPAEVIEDPESVPWAQLDPSRTHAVIGGVVAYALGLGTKDAWRSAWEPLGIAADHGRADVAAWGAHRLGKSRPAGTTPPKAARKFADVLDRINVVRAAEKAADAATDTGKGDAA